LNHALENIAVSLAFSSIQEGKMTQRHVMSRAKVKQLLQQLNLEFQPKLPRFGRQVIVVSPNGALLRIDKAYDTGSPAKDADTFVITVD